MLVRTGEALVIERDAAPGRKLDLDDVHGGAGAGRRDVAAHVASRRIAPGGLICPARERAGGYFSLREQNGERYAQAAADLSEKLCGRTGFAPLDPGQHRPADRGVPGEAVQRQFARDPQRPHASANPPIDVAVCRVHICIVHSIIVESRKSRSWSNGQSDKRSKERRVGKECVSTSSTRWSPYH